MPDAGEGYQETGLELSRVLPEASDGATVRYRMLDQMGPWPDPAGLFLCSYENEGCQIAASFIEYKLTTQEVNVAAE